MPSITSPDQHPVDPDRALYAYLVMLGESDQPPDDREPAQIGMIRRGPSGLYWIFDGEGWREW